MLCIALTTTPYSATENSKSLVEEIEEAVLSKIETIKSKNTPIPEVAQISTTPKVKNPPKTPEVPPLPIKTTPKVQPVQDKNISKLPAVPTFAASVTQPTLTNPRISLINATNMPCTVFTTASMEQAQGGLNQTQANVKSYRSTTVPLTNRAQQFMGARINNPTAFSDTTNIMPISLVTPVALICSDSPDTTNQTFNLQYLPHATQNGMIIINPTTNVYTLNIMNTLTEQISAPANNPNYTILTITLPARSTVPLPLITNTHIRLHLTNTENEQVTKMKYPTSAGYYLIQELQPEQMPRNSFRLNDYASGTEFYLYLRPISAS